jgi:iron complex transport system ATP-binding protein
LQKVLLAKTLIQQTPVVILDEPLSYLDYGTKKFILSKLSELIKMENKIIIMSSHDVHICSNYANAMLLMHNKKWLYTSADKVSEQKLFSDFLMTEV